MLTKEFELASIPALIWGPPSANVWLAVHGNQSHKADTVIQLLAEDACAQGCQVFSFDLPEHGGRQGKAPLCKAQLCVPELRRMFAYAQAHWETVSLFACSMGAYFSLLAFPQMPLVQCLLLAPVVDMQTLIQQLMLGYQVTEQQLETAGAIPLPGAPTLYWDYYCYAQTNPITTWTAPTAILCGSQDQLCPPAQTKQFANRFHCRLDMLPSAGHFFHTPAELAAYQCWLKTKLRNNR